MGSKDKNTQNGSKANAENNKRTFDLVDLKFYQEICQNSRNAVLVIEANEDKEFFIKYANPIYLKLRNVKPEEIYEKNIEHLVLTDKGKVNIEKIKACFELRSVVEFTIDYGEIGVFITRLCPIIESDKVVRIISSHTEIPRCEMVKKDEKRQNDIKDISPIAGAMQFEDLCNLSRNPMFILYTANGTEYFVKYFNQAFEHLIDYKLSDLIGKNIIDVVHSNRWNDLYSNLKKCVQDNLVMEMHFEFRKRVVLIKLQPIVGDDGFVRILGTCTDTLQNSLDDTSGSERVLRERLAFEEMMASTLKAFISAEFKGFEDFTACLLSGMAEKMDVDEVFFIRNKNNLNEKSICSHPYDEQAHKAKSPEARRGMKLIHKYFAKGNSLCIDDIVQINTVQAEFKYIIDKYGMKSLVGVPVANNDEYIGFLSLIQYKEARKWTLFEISRLRVAAKTIASAYVRSRQEKREKEEIRLMAKRSESLDKILATDEIVVEASKVFANSSVKGFDKCVNDLLGEMGELFNVDRTSAYMTHIQNPNTYNVYEWCKEGIPSYADTVMKIDSEAFYAYYKMRAPHGIMAIANAMENMGDFPKSLMNEMIRSGISSYLAVPVEIGDSAYGLICFHMVIGHNEWTKPTTIMAKAFAELLIEAYAKNCVEIMLMKKAEKPLDEKPV